MAAFVDLHHFNTCALSCIRDLLMRLILRQNAGAPLFDSLPSSAGGFHSDTFAQTHSMKTAIHRHQILCGKGSKTCIIICPLIKAPQNQRRLVY